MDVLCTDKTGTLTMDHVILELYCDFFQKGKSGGPARCLRHQPLQTGLKTSSIAPWLQHQEMHRELSIEKFQES